jgi:hypothetical protein
VPAPALAAPAENDGRCAPVGLCLVERKIGVRDQIVDVEPIIGSNRDACAAAQVQRMITDNEGLRELVQHRADYLIDPARIGAIRHDQDKLVPAETKHLPGLGVAFADHA